MRYRWVSWIILTKTCFWPVIFLRVRNLVDFSPLINLELYISEHSTGHSDPSARSMVHIIGSVLTSWPFVWNSMILFPGTKLDQYPFLQRNFKCFSTELEHIPSVVSKVDKHFQNKSIHSLLFGNICHTKYHKTENLMTKQH